MQKDSTAQYDLLAHEKEIVNIVKHVDKFCMISGSLDGSIILWSLKVTYMTNISI